MTKAKKKTEPCDGKECPCMERCPLECVFDTIGGKWKVAILCSLTIDGPLRYNTLKRKISGITNTMLALSLKELADAGLVKRVQYPEMPVRVEYSTTSAVHDLAPILRQLGNWGAKRLM